MLKPARQDSALGIKFARTGADAPAALVAALSYDRKVLLERHVDGRDLAVSIVERDDGPTALPIVEAVPREEHFYDFEARYEIGRTEFVCPADLGPGIAERSQRLAVDAYRLLGCFGFARVDLMLERGTDELFVLEADAVPGLTETSLLPQAAEEAGIAFDGLVGQMIDLAVRRAAAPA